MRTARRRAGALFLLAVICLAGCGHLRSGGDIDGKPWGGDDGPGIIGVPF